jgi:cytochrome c oxidase subunit 1
MGAVVYWFPKLTGRMLEERVGRVSFYVVMVGFNVTFLAMFYAGLQGMPRRVADYPPQFATANLIATLGAYTIAVGMLLFLYCIVHSWRSGAPAGPNPWRGKTLEWFVPSPPPLENFEVLPVVTGDAYGYGESDSHHTSHAGVVEHERIDPEVVQS